ncbi:peptidoglycan-binding protein [Streptomyces sp. NPDC005166]
MNEDPQLLDDETEAGAGLSRARRWVIAVAVGAVVLTGTGVGASLLIKSPAQAAADSAPPPADVLTAPVDKRVLRSSVILRGTVVAGQSLDVTPVAAGAGDGGTTPTVTKTPLKAGDAVLAGKPLIEVSGRPVIALPGALPVYRDLKPGAEGDDVTQLQRALAGLGHGTAPDPSGTYGPGTKGAVSKLYTSLGYDPAVAGGDDGEGLKAAEQLVKSQERAVEDAQDTLDTAQAAEGASEASGGSGGGAGDAGAPGTSGAADGADGADGAAAAGGRAGGSGGSGLKELRKNLTRAQQDLADARTALAAVQAADGPMLPASEVVFLEKFPARVDSVSAHVGSQVSGPVMKVSAGALVVHGYLQAHQKGLIREGQKVDVLSEITGTQAAARVQSVAGSPTVQQSGSSGQGGEQSGAQAPATGGGSGYLMVVRPDRKLPAELAGQDVRLTVESSATEGEVLVVPVSAVSAGADGRTVVTVVTGQGQESERRRVSVRPGTNGDGFVEVTPLSPGTLREGDRVLTGLKQPDGSGGEGATP